jgi:pimeloyl-ACP methyl ester carboxylesterase
MLTKSQALSNELGSEHNIVSFDPRGVNNSDINLDCFRGVTGAIGGFMLQAFTRPSGDGPETARRRQWKLGRKLGERCTAAQGPKKLSRYANTVAVANDMRHYIELRARSLGNPVEKSRLWYYGVSYGTVLGATFAALFPDRVGRMILDAVQDADDYYSGRWLSSLRDTDATVRTFFESCFEAGKERCAFHGNAESAEQLEDRFNRILDFYTEQPETVPIDVQGASSPFIIDFPEIVKLSAFMAAYNPIQGFPILAGYLALLELSIAVQSTGRRPTDNGLNEIIPRTDSLNVLQMMMQISCIDQAGRTNVSTFEQYESHVNHLVNQSFIAGNQFGVLHIAPCPKLDIKPQKSQLLKGNIESPLLH